MSDNPGVAEEPPMTRVNVPALRLALTAVMNFNHLRQSEVCRASGLNPQVLNAFLKQGTPMSGNSTLVLLHYLGLANELALAPAPGQPEKPEPVVLVPAGNAA